MVFGGWGLEKEQLKKGLALLLLLGLVVSGALAWSFYERFIKTELFIPGVKIGGVSVQGKNQDEAVELVNTAVDEMHAAQVSFYHENYSHSTRLGNLALPIDAGQIVQSVWQAEKKRDWKDKIMHLNGNREIDYPVTFAYNSDVKASLIQEWESKWGIPFKNAIIEVDSQRGLITVPGQAGIRVDAEATFKVLPAQLATISSINAPIIFEHQEPSVNEAMLKHMGELSSYSTLFNAGDVNRSQNLYMATASINKSVVAPQTVFSFNNTVGMRTMERGYLDALVIVGNRFEPGLGGGICQVSSTLYNACLLAGLEIVERSNHGLSVAYVPLGRDATVAYGIQDYKFRNNTDSPIYIRAVTARGKLTINIYGDLKNKQNISVTNFIDQTLDFVTVRETDPSLQPGEQKVDHTGHPGYVVRSFRNYHDSNGKIVKTEQLARDRYQPLNTLILEGPIVTAPPVIEPKLPSDPVKPGNSSQPGAEEQPPSNPPSEVPPAGTVTSPVPEVLPGQP